MNYSNEAIFLYFSRDEVKKIPLNTQGMGTDVQQLRDGVGKPCLCRSWKNEVVPQHAHEMLALTNEGTRYTIYSNNLSGDVAIEVAYKLFLEPRKNPPTSLQNPWKSAARTQGLGFKIAKKHGGPGEKVSRN